MHGNPVKRLLLNRRLMRGLRRKRDDSKAKAVSFMIRAWPLLMSISMTSHRFVKLSNLLMAMLFGWTLRILWKTVSCHLAHRSTYRSGIISTGQSRQKMPGLRRRSGRVFLILSFGLKMAMISLCSLMARGLVTLQLWLGVTWILDSYSLLAYGNLRHGTQYQSMRYITLYEQQRNVGMWLRSSRTSMSGKSLPRSPGARCSRKRLTFGPSRPGAIRSR